MRELNFQIYMIRSCFLCWWVDFSLFPQLYSELPKIVYLRDVGDIALSLSNINKEIVFFSLNGTDYSGSKPINDDSFIYGTGYAVLRYDSYIGEVGYVKNYKFVYNVKNKQFKWL